MTQQTQGDYQLLPCPMCKFNGVKSVLINAVQHVECGICECTAPMETWQIPRAASPLIPEGYAPIKSAYSDEEIAEAIALAELDYEGEEICECVKGICHEALVFYQKEIHTQNADNEAMKLLESVLPDIRVLLDFYPLETQMRKDFQRRVVKKYNAAKRLIKAAAPQPPKTSEGWQPIDIEHLEWAIAKAKAELDEPNVIKKYLWWYPLYQAAMAFKQQPPQSASAQEGER